MFKGLTGRLNLTIAIILAVALFCTTGLNYLRFDQTYLRLIEERLVTLAAELRTAAHTGLDLGLTLRSMENLEALVARKSRGDEALTAVVVHDCEGQIVVADGTPRLTPPQAGPDGAMAPFSTLSGDRIAVGLPLFNSFGDCAGGVMLEMSAAAYVAATERVRGELLLASGLAFLLVIPALWFTSHAFRQHRRLMRGLNADLDNLLDGSGSRPAMSAESTHIWDDDTLLASYRQARPILIERLRRQMSSKSGDTA